MFAIGTVVTLPYVLSIYDAQKNITEKSGVAVVSPEDDKLNKETSNTLNIFKRELDLLNPGKTLLATGLINQVIQQKPKDVKITNFSISADDKSKKVMVIDGVAGSRESLLLFGKNLGADKTFSKVDLPISGFSKKADIEYTITLTIQN
jgi:hypothetical protein